MSSLNEWNSVPAAPPRSVFARIVGILDAVRESAEPMSVTEIAQRTAIPKSSVSRLVTEMIDQRYLARMDGGVTLGLRMFELGARARMPRRLIAAALPIVGELARTTGERVGLWVHQGRDMIAVATVPGRLPMLPTRAGTRFPTVTTASGKAFLAFCRDASVLERASAGMPDRAADELRVELTRVRATVVATDSGGAYPGIDAVASPVLTPDRTVLGAISVAGPAGIMRADEIAPIVRSAGEALSRRLEAA